MNEWLKWSEWMNEWMDEWMIGWMHAWMDCCCWLLLAAGCCCKLLCTSWGSAHVSTKTHGPYSAQVRSWGARVRSRNVCIANERLDTYLNLKISISCCKMPQISQQGFAVFHFFLSSGISPCYGSRMGRSAAAEGKVCSSRREDLQQQKGSSEGSSAAAEGKVCSSRREDLQQKQRTK